MRPDDLSLYVVTDPDLVGDRNLLHVCEQALAAGVRLIQLRDKRASTRALVARARALAPIASRHAALLLVNDRVDVALAAGADGVHLGQDDMPLGDARRLMGPDAVIGISVQSPAEASAAEQDGATYLAANMVFPTPTKTDLGTHIGLEGVRRLRSTSTLPLVAIGGIQASNASDVVAAGADGVAVVSAVMAAPDVSGACRALLGAVEAGKRRRRG